MECKQCHNEFTPTRIDNVFCSKRCKANDIYHRRKHTNVYKANRKKVDVKARFTHYGITETDYNRMFEEQEGKCKICGRHQSDMETSLAIYHDHNTGIVRGLLCNKCNVAIGLLNDNIGSLQAAIQYLSN